MKQISTISELKDLLQDESNIGLVPTMGALHKGHTSLIERSTKECSCTIVSIFINPIQFGQNEDLDKYPKQLEDDLNICKDIGADIVFTPSINEIYPEGKENTTIIHPQKEFINCLCGLTRPNLFPGALTIVKKLFDITKPQKAFFGEKDYQQLFLIKKMVEEYNLNIDIIGCPIVREENGLAMSSRNQYLSKEDRKQAAKIYQSLKKAKDKINSNNDTETVFKEILNNRELGHIEYIELRNPYTLAKTTSKPMRLFIATQLSGTRLIDNIEV